jgi:NAD-dependent dihydropyrimidine dehydrogenase PreA subunit
MKTFIRSQASIDEALCVACGSCLKVCPREAILPVSAQP